MTILNAGLLIASFLICIGSFFVPQPQITQNKRIQTLIPLLIVLAVITAAAVRCASFSVIPGGVNQDEAMAAVDAKALSDYGTDRLGMVYPVHFQAWGFGQMSVLLSYCMIPFIRLLGFSTFSIRLPMLLFSLIGLGILYFYSRETFNPVVALIVLLLGAVNPWHIVQSRWSIDCNLFPHVLLIGLYLLSHGLKNKNHRFCLYLSMVSFGLSMYCYGISIYTVPIFLLICVICLLCQHKVSFLEAGVCAVVYLLVAGPFILMIIINTFGLETIETPFFTIPYFEDSVRKADILFFSDHPLKQLVTNAIAFARILLQVGDDYIWNVVPGFATMYVFSTPFAILGFVQIIRKISNDTSYLIFLVFLATAVFCGILTNCVNVNRVNLLFYPLIILDGLGIYTVVEKSRYFTFSVLTIYVLSFSLFCVSYFNSYASAIAGSFNQDFGLALSALDTSKQDPIYITPDVVSPETSEIYTLYYCDIDAKEYQSASFKQKYHFMNPTPSIIASSPDSQYIISAWNKDLFDETLFEMTPYGRYYLVRRYNRS